MNKGLAEQYGETCCYMRDPDGYIIEVGQSSRASPTAKRHDTKKATVALAYLAMVAEDGLSFCHHGWRECPSTQSKSQ